MELGVLKVLLTICLVFLIISCRKKSKTLPNDNSKLSPQVSTRSNSSVLSNNENSFPTLLPKGAPPVKRINSYLEEKGSLSPSYIMGEFKINDMDILVFGGGDCFRCDGSSGYIVVQYNDEVYTVGNLRYAELLLGKEPNRENFPDNHTIVTTDCYFNRFVVNFKDKTVNKIEKRPQLALNLLADLKSVCIGRTFPFRLKVSHVKEGLSKGQYRERDVHYGCIKIGTYFRSFNSSRVTIVAPIEEHKKIRQLIFENKVIDYNGLPDSFDDGEYVIATINIDVFNSFEHGDRLEEWISDNTY